MKKLALFFAVVATISLFGMVMAASTVEEPAACVHCGMDRTKFSHSRMLIQYEDGTKVGTCSLNCVAVDLDQNKGKKIKGVQVADYGTRTLIDAPSATWVMGGKVKGVMTKAPKWAFADKKDAEAFIAQNEGEIVTYQAAMNAAAKDKKMKQAPAAKPEAEHKGH